MESAEISKDIASASVAEVNKKSPMAAAAVVVSPTQIQTPLTTTTTDQSLALSSETINKSVSENATTAILPNEIQAMEANITAVVEAATDDTSTPESVAKITKRKEADDSKRIRLKRRKIKVAGAPKMPLTGYVRYMNDRREELRTEMPAKTAMEHTKIIGEEWNQLSDERKAPYMKAAQIDKDRYTNELNAFLKDRPDILAAEIAKDKVRKNNSGSGKSVLADKSNSNTTNTGHNPNKVGFSAANKNISLVKATKMFAAPGSATNTRRLSVNYSTASAFVAAPPSLVTAKPLTSVSAPSPVATPVPGSIPIFTEEFLEHNKIFDMELRTLRKSKSDFEQQNDVLEKHVENMKFGVEKMATENDELQEKNRLLEAYLEKLKSKLAQALSGLAIPTEPNGATVDNIDKYMNDLYKMATTNTHGPASLNKAKDIIRKLDLQIQL